MSKYTLTVWIIMVVAIFACILTIGIKYKQEYPYIKYKEKLKESAKKYIKEESAVVPDKNINIVITTSELKKMGYIKTTKVKEKDCKGKVTVSYEKKNYKYDVEVKC